MKNLAIILVIFINAGVLFIGAQPNKTNANNEELIISKDDDAKKIDNLIKDSTFVLEADWLSDKWGNRVSVSSMINFIKVDEKDAVIQVGSNQGLGRNGVGGVTADGKVTKFEVNELGKNKGYYVNFSVMTSMGTYDINMSISNNGSTRATLSGIGPGKLFFDGYLYSLEESEVYKGTSSY